MKNCRNDNIRRNIFKSLPLIGGSRWGALIIALALAIMSYAQDIIVTMTPTQQILPPQALLYLSQPNQYFNVSLMNTTSEPKQVYLAMNLQQVTPSTGISIRVGARRQPERPFVVPANGTYQLTMVDMKKLFDHVPSSEVQSTPGLFSDYSNGSLGLLPEGDYEAQMIAYQWNPALQNPVATSNPNGGKCSFTICYKAQAPQFLTPMVANMADITQVAELDPNLPQFTWTAPIVSCNPAAANFQYRIKIVELLKNQSPNDAMDKNPVVYQSPSALVSPLCLLPQTVANKLDPTLTYVAQVTATVANLQSTYLNYAMIENDGKSTYRMFKVKGTKKEEVTEEKKEEKKDEKEDEKKDEDDDEDDLDIRLSGKYGWEKDPNALYTFRNPQITTPSFGTGEKRRSYTYESILAKWNAVWFVGGNAQRPDTLDIEYKVNLYAHDTLLETQSDIDQLYEQEPVWTKQIKETTDTIEYRDIKDKVSAGQYLYLHVVPVCKNEKSIAYVDSLCNQLSWALIDRPTKTYFQCSNTVEIDDNTPTKKKAKDLKGTTVAMGEYNLTIDEIEDAKGVKNRFKGKGHIEWKPLGFKVMVAVQFDSIGINKDNIVFAGEAKTYPRPEMSSADAVNEIFTDLGIDDWASDLGLPYGSTVDKYTMEGAKKVAEKVDISQYYKYVKTGQNIWDDLKSGEIKDLHFPVQIPKDINKSPVDIQLFSATFAPQYAQMNVIGEFTLPESKYTKDNILMLAAPRLCISPERLLPESGTLALMKDFTILDPKSQFEFTFNAPDDLEAPTKGCFVSWHADELELFDIDVTMLIPNIKKVDDKGNKTDELPAINLHASIGGWDDWYAEGEMDSFMSEDLDGWIFQPGKIAYDHSVYRSATKFSGLPKEYDRVKAGMQSAASDDKEWQGLFIEDMGIVFPKMLKVDDESKNWEGHLKLMAEKILLDDSGISLNFGLKNVFDIETGKAGGWGISMEEVMLNVTQNTFKEAWFKGKIKVPLDGLISYQCNIIAQGKDDRKAGEEGFTYVFSTQQVDSLSFDFWVGKMDFDKDQTYFLLEADTYKNKDDEVRVELSIGGTLSITIGRDWLKKQNKIGAFLDAHIPGIHVAGMRIANCERWKSKHFQNIYNIDKLPTKGTILDINETFGLTAEYNCGGTGEKGNFYFSIGRWSLASPSKKLGPFEFKLTHYGFQLNGTEAELLFTGEITVCEVLTAGCGLSISANVDVNNFSFSFGGVHFKEAILKTGFGGVKVEGTLSVANGEDEGFGATLDIALPGDLFKLSAKGGFYTRKVKTTVEGVEQEKKVGWGYLTAECSVQGGIPIPPIVINGIKGGFYFNCRPSVTNAKDEESKPTFEEGQIGFMLGMFITTAGGENTLKADMDLTVIFDTKNERLSSMILRGNLSAIGSGDTYLIDAGAQLVYQDDDKSRYFDLNITANGSAKLDKEIQEKLEAFAGKVMKAAEACKAGLGNLTSEEQGNGKNGAEEKKGSDGSFSGGVCKATISINFRIETFKQGENKDKTKWHLYIGKPPYDERCSITLIDFQAGAKTDRFAVWAYLGANMYFCLGNELPNDGQLPEIPEKAKAFLDGNDINGKTQGLSSTAQSDSQKQVQEMIAMVNESGCEGGIMLGACAEGDFGVNAGIVYAHAYACLGFDVMLKKLEPGQKCRGGGQMGYKGWYGMGQAYVVLIGDLGLHIDLWFIKKDLPIIEVGVGALLQAGLPNPTWCYGKARATLTLLGGLFKFDRSVEFKAGDVCKPDYGDPLDNITIVADAQPGDTLESVGNKTVTSAYAMPRFTTNYAINKEVRIVDKNKQADAVEKYRVSDEEAAGLSERSYRFIIKSVKIYKERTSGRGWNLFSEATWDMVDETNFNVQCKQFDPQTKYYMEITSAAQEYNTETYKWDDPLIDGKRKPKVEVKNFYFKTGTLSDDIANDIAYALPARGSWNEMRLEDLNNPYICLNRKRDDIAGSGTAGYGDYGYRWVLYKDNKRIDTRENYVDRETDYETWRPQTPFNVTGAGSNNYRVALVRYVKGAGANTANRNFKTVTKKNRQLVNSNGFVSTAGTSALPSNNKRPRGNTDLSYIPSSSSNAGTNYAKQMQEFFEQEDKASAAENKVDVTTKEGYKDDVALASNEKDMFAFDCKKTVTGSYESSSYIYDYETVYQNISSFTQSKTYLYVTAKYDYEYVNKEFHKMTPYYLMTYLSKHAFLGGLSFGAYAFSDLASSNMRGLQITFPYEKLRKKYVYDGLYADLKRTDAKNMETAADEFTPIAGKLYKYDQGSTNKIRLTQLHRDFLSALAGDAMGMRNVQYYISKDMRTVVDVIQKTKKNSKSDSDYKTKVTALNDKDYKDTYTTQVISSGYSQSMSSTDPDYSPNIKFNMPGFTVPWKHYFQYYNMVKKYGVKTIDKVSGVKDFRNNNTERENVFLFLYSGDAFDPKAYLNTISQVGYRLARIDRYNINKYTMETNKSSNVKFVQVNKPFSFYIK